MRRPPSREPPLHADPTRRAIVLGPRAHELRDYVGSTAWAVLEEMMQRSTGAGDHVVAQVSIRSLASSRGLAKDTVNRAVRRLRDLGAIRARPLRQRCLPVRFLPARRPDRLPHRRPINDDQPPTTSPDNTPSNHQHHQHHEYPEYHRHGHHDPSTLGRSCLKNVRWSLRDLHFVRPCRAEPASRSGAERANHRLIARTLAGFSPLTATRSMASSTRESTSAPVRRSYSLAALRLVVRRVSFVSAATIASTRSAMKSKMPVRPSPQGSPTRSMFHAIGRDEGMAVAGALDDSGPGL